jgi:endonuclease-3
MPRNEVERARLVHDILVSVYPVMLPFLRYTTPFELLTAVILSARTTDAAVNAATPALFKAFPDAAALAAASQEDVEALVHSLGYYRVKARSIRMAARKLVDAYKGKVPDTMEELLLLPGVGRKTAHVVLCQIYGKPAIIVDTHFSRVAQRLGFTETRDPVQVEKIMASLLPEDIRSSFSMRLNRHGRAVCTARSPGCASCPLKDLCRYR